MARAILLLLIAFWLTMNVLLWRAEYGAHPGLGSSVPAKVVWEKILTAPDSSSLAVFQRGKKVGFCHWITSVGEDLSRLSSREAPPEGMVPDIAGYKLDLEGNLMLSEPGQRFRFETHLLLSPNQEWREFDLRLNLHPSSWEVRSVAAKRTVRFSWQDESGKFERELKFSELEHPDQLLQEFGGPFAAGALGGLLSPGGRRGGPPSLGLTWDARQDSIRLGHSPVRVYRLQAHLLDRFSVVIFVSRVGEILKVELPDGYTLTNDQLGVN